MEYHGAQLRRWHETKMKKKRLLTVGILVVIIATTIFISPPCRFVRGMARQMKAGQTYLDSLTDADLPGWINRADALLATHKTEARAPGDFPIPDDLKAVKIGGIDVLPPDYVGFMWLGGMDHTGLLFRKDSNGMYTVTAEYSNEREKQLWPKVEKKWDNN